MYFPLEKKGVEVKKTRWESLMLKYIKKKNTNTKQLNRQKGAGLAMWEMEKKKTQSILCIAGRVITIMIW